MEGKHMQIQIGKDKHPVDGYDALTDVESDGLLFYEEVSSSRAERFVKCWNSHDALLDACNLGLSIARWAATVKGGPSMAKADVKALEAAIAQAEKG